jgi:hypothetical protein
MPRGIEWACNTACHKCHPSFRDSIVASIYPRLSRENKPTGIEQIRGSIPPRGASLWNTYELVGDMPLFVPVMPTMSGVAWADDSMHHPKRGARMK